MNRPVRSFWVTNIRIITLNSQSANLQASLPGHYLLLHICLFLCLFLLFFLPIVFFFPLLFLLFTFNVNPSWQERLSTHLEMRMLLQRAVLGTAGSSVPWRSESHWATSQKYATGPTCSCAAAESIFCLAWRAVEEDTDTAMFCLSHLMSSHMQDNCKNRSTSATSDSQHLQKQKWY